MTHGEHVDALIDAARSIADAADATDDTDDSYLTGLEQLVASIDDEAGLSEVGRLALDSQIVTNLANRFRVAAWAAGDPAVGEEAIERPVFILGLPRTGTTLLSYLLDQDPRVRSLMRWEAMNSVPPPRQETFTTDPRIAETREGQAMLDTLNPGFKAIHYEAPDGPTECVAILSQDFKSILWETVANVPGYSAWLRTADYTSAYRYHRQLLQLLQSAAPGRWILKSPGHRLALDALLATYPDATFVVTHRDPVTVVASTCSLIISLSGTFSDADHRSYITSHWIDLIDDMVRRVDEARDRDATLDARFLDVDYHELVADPLRIVRRAYDHIDAELTPDAEAAMHSYASANAKGKYGRHAYTLADLGLDRGELDDRFAAYRTRYGIGAKETVA